MKPQPLVSIVIPAYNHGQYLDEAIRSILEQDYPNVELIVIDDGSTDNTKDVLEKYKGRFYSETQPNQGQVATLNKGWRMSRGDVLAYLSADDLLLPGAISSAVKCLEDTPDAVLTYCDFNLIDPHSLTVRRVTTPEFDYREMAVEFVCAPGPGAFFTRPAFERAGVWNSDFKQMLDYEYWLRLGLCGRFVRIPEVLAAYRVHPGSQTFAATSQIRPEEPVTIIERYFERADIPDSVRPFRKRALSNAHLRAAYLYFRTGNPRPGISELGRAFRLWPANMLAMRTFRLLLNAFFNRMGHRALWTVRSVVRKISRGRIGRAN